MSSRNVILLALAALVLLSPPGNDLQAQRVNEWVINKNALTNPFKLAAADGRHLACIGRIDFDNAIMLSSDGGQNWHTAFTEPSGDNSQSTFAEIKYHAVTQPHPDLVLVARSRFEGESEQRRFSLLRSSDAGASWTTIQFSHNPQSSETISIDFCDTKHGILATTRSLLKTDDGGLSWSNITLPAGEVSSFRAIFCFDDKSFIAAAIENIYHSGDGGDTWHRSEPLPSGIMNFDFHDSSLGWAVAWSSTGVGDRQRDLVYATTDGGAIWTPILNEEIEPAFGLTDVDFADANNGIAVGRIAKLLRTTDGGVSWVKERTPFAFANSVISHIVFPAPDIAVALGVNTMLRYTGNTVLAPPTLTLNASAADLTGRLTWAGANSAQSYRLQISAKVPGQFDNSIDAFASQVSFDSSGIVDREFVLDGRLSYGRRYFFRVQAMLNDETSDWSKASTLLTDEDPDFVELEQPVLIAPESSALISGQTVDFQWESVAGAEWYDFQISDDFQFAGEPTYSDDNVGSTTYSVETAILNPSTLYFWRVRARSEKGIGNWRGRAFQTGVLSAVAGDTAPIETSTALRSYPNPADASTTIDFTIAAASSITIRVINLRGETLDTIVDDVLYPAGTHSVHFDSARLSAGNYILTLRGSRATAYLPFIVKL